MAVWGASRQDRRKVAASFILDGSDEVVYMLYVICSNGICNHGVAQGSILKNLSSRHKFVKQDTSLSTRHKIRNLGQKVTVVYKSRNKTPRSKNRRPPPPWPTVISINLLNLYGYIKAFFLFARHNEEVVLSFLTVHRMRSKQYASTCNLYPLPLFQAED